MNKNLQSIASFFAKLFAPITWKPIAALFNDGVYYKLNEFELDNIRKMLKNDYYIILNRKNAHLTTHLISLVSFILSRKFSHYSHVLMNVEGDRVDTDNDFRLIEAQANGVVYSSFMQVFDCDSVCLLVPKGINPTEWTSILETAMKQFGKPYDNMFDLLEGENVSCVEMVRIALQSLPDYQTRFANLEALIKKHENLTPQMYYDCGDFDIIYEVRH